MCALKLLIRIKNFDTMKNLLISLFCLLAVNVSAQIVQFSDELLSQYDNKKQDSILERPIDLDMIYTPFDLTRGNISGKGEFSAKFDHNYNYVGYHVYILKSDDNEYVLSFSSNYDTVALDVMPEGVYEVVGMLVSNEEVEDIRNLIMDSLIICKENSISYIFSGGDKWIYNEGKNSNLTSRGFSANFTYRDFLKYYSDEYLSTLGSVADINRAIHNGEEIKKDRTTLVLKGNNDHLYYISYKIRENTFGLWNTWHNNYHVPYMASIDLQKAVIVEQYEYMKEFLLKNEFLIQTDNHEFTITTNKGLEYNFSDTIGLKICDLAIKEKEGYNTIDLIAVMKIGPDSILYYDVTDWSKEVWSDDEWCADSAIYSDTIGYLKVEIGEGRRNFSIVCKCDLEKIDQAKRILDDRVKACEAELEAKRLAEEERERLRMEAEQRIEELERQKEIAEEKAEEERERQRMDAQQREWERIQQERFEAQEKERLRREAEQREWKRKRQAEKQSLIAKYGAKFGALVFEHKVTLGMTKEMCLKAWGKPRNKVIRRVRFGTQEVWFYGVSQYLVFDNGVLVECASRS